MLRLSTFHRYGIAILALIVIAALFWPTGDKSNSTPNNTSNVPNQPIVIPPTSLPNPIPDTVLSQPEQPTTNIPDTSPPLPSEPEIIQAPACHHSHPRHQPLARQLMNGRIIAFRKEKHWRSYFVIITCRQMMPLSWQKLKVQKNPLATCSKGRKSD